MATATPERPDVETQVLPPYGVFIENDDDHSFQYVFELLRDVFHYTEDKCFKFTMKAHEDGEAMVWSGSKEVAELKLEMLKNGGADIHAEKDVTFGLGCYMEPLPG